MLNISKIPLFFLFFSCLTFSFYSGCEDNNNVSNNQENNLNNDAGHDLIDIDSDMDSSVPDCSEHAFEEVKIPMGDGAELAATIRKPINPDCTLPTILIQTPYGKENSFNIWFEDENPGPLFASTDYNFVVMDWRGFFGSASAPENPSRTNYGFDGYDAVEWIARQNWSDGQVGTWGVSALCRVQYETAVFSPPHLKAIVPVFCALNNGYQQYYPGGVLRREYVDFVTSYFGGSPQLYEEHPYQDNVWNYLGSVLDISNILVPALVVSGWYDLYNTATINNYQGLVNTAPSQLENQHRLLIGPWHHFSQGGESTMGRPLTEQEMLYYDSNKEVQSKSLQFFDFHLRAMGELPEEQVEYKPDGSNEFLLAGSWPPTSTEVNNYYLCESGLALSPQSLESSYQYEYNPEDPSPSIGGQTIMPDYYHGPAYLDEVISREDNLVLTYPVLEDLHLEGTMSANLEVTTSAPDTDFAVRITKVDSDGRHLLIGEGIRRLKLREQYTAPSEVVPGQRYEINIPITNHHGFWFSPGDRLGIIITSSNYPRFDINPNTGEDFYDTDAQIAVNTVYFNENSYLSITTRANK
ncbi:MAG: CocE/NonD family hydrolase [Deltaproteobacteria bacterium]|jgi:predicted acyl esterase|nr:CocE/NonD family hydrolase [Deltaproteobacteria bacterium]